jgi:glycosyltransferase involved in cell wall biosynthesis
MAELSRRLVAERGHAVTVSTTTALSTADFRRPGVPELAHGESWEDGVRVRRHRVVKRVGAHLHRAQDRAYRWDLPGNGILRTIYEGPLSPGMAVDAARTPADVVAATAFPLAHMHVAVLAARARRLPVVLFGALHPEDLWGFDRAVIRRAIKAATAYAAYTDYEADYVRSLGMRPDRVHVVPPGVDPAPFQSTDRRGHSEARPVVGFFGQMTAHKGLLDLLAAMEIVWKRLPGSRLVIAGARRGGTELIERSLRELPEQQRACVHLESDVPEARKAELFASFDVFASPSAYESFGITFLEAWASGLPIVACRVGAVASVVHDGVDGVLVQPGAPAQLAAALERLLTNPSECRRMGQSGRDTVLTQHSWAAITARVSELYASLAGAALTRAS